MVTCMRLRFTIRDLLWLTLVAALACGWWVNHPAPAQNHRNAHRRNFAVTSDLPATNNHRRSFSVMSDAPAKDERATRKATEWANRP